MLAGPLVGGAIAAGASAASGSGDDAGEFTETAQNVGVAQATAATSAASQVDRTAIVRSELLPVEARPAAIPSPVMPPSLTPPVPLPVSSAPAPSATVSSTPADAVSNASIGQFISFVQSQMERDPVLLPRLSAILREPSALDGYRTYCGTLPVAVAVDLDPVGGVVDPGELPKWTEALAPQLDGLRTAGLTVAWLSNLPGTAEPALRRALLTNGLDLVAGDRLLLGKNDSRKQQRRESLQEDHCLVAILGDDLTDFDELFDYLLKPEDAWQLDEMMDQGWFLLDRSKNPQPETE